MKHLSRENILIISLLKFRNKCHVCVPWDIIVMVLFCCDRWTCNWSIASPHGFCQAMVVLEQNDLKVSLKLFYANCQETKQSIFWVMNFLSILVFFYSIVWDYEGSNVDGVLQVHMHLLLKIFFFFYLFLARPSWTEETEGPKLRGNKMLK